MKNVYLLKSNLLVQIGGEEYKHQLALMTPNKSFLNRLDLNVYNPSQSYKDFYGALRANLR